MVRCSLRKRTCAKPSCSSSGAGVVRPDGRRHSSDLEHLLSEALTAEDLETVASRPFEEKSRTRASFERAQMVRERLLVERRDGVWELDADGWTSFRILDR